MDHAGEAEHGEAAVLDLLELHGGHVLLAHAHRVELEVTGSALALEGVEEGDSAENLEERDPEEDLAHGSGLDELVVESGHLGAASDLGERGVDGDVLEDGAGGGKHGNTAVLDLGLAEEADVTERGEAEGVEADVAGHGAVEGLGGLEEGNRGRHLHGGSSGGNCREDRVEDMVRWNSRLPADKVVGAEILSAAYVVQTTRSSSLHISSVHALEITPPKFPLAFVANMSHAGRAVSQ